MNEMSIRGSFSNLTQVDRLQQQKNTHPIVSQEQNAELMKQTIAQRLNAPVQPDAVEGKQIDPNNKKQREAEKRKKKKKLTADTNRKDLSKETGRIIDYNA